MPISMFSVGDTASTIRIVSEEIILEFANVSRDMNPVHLDDAYAEKTIFKKRIAHGLLCTSMVSEVLGMQLPGPGTILIEEHFYYKNAVYIGDEIVARGEITKIIKEKNFIELAFTCIKKLFKQQQYRLFFLGNSMG